MTDSRDLERHIKEALAVANSHSDGSLPRQPGYFSAGWNMPGYLPESEPAAFDSATDALMYLRDTLDHWANGMDHANDGALIMSYESTIAEVEETIRSVDSFNLLGGFTFHTADYVLWVAPITKQEYDQSHVDL